MEIRKLTNKDAESVSALIKECFEAIDLGGHTEEGKRIQIESNNPQNLMDIWNVGANPCSFNYLIWCVED